MTAATPREEVAARGLDHLQALVLFLFQTGFRVGEVVRLTPEDFDLAAGSVTAATTKNGKPRSMSLTAEMVRELRALPPREGLTFGYTSEAGVRQGLRRVCAGAGVPYLGTHQPGRHSFATALDGAGMSPKAVADAGGWDTVRISQGYVHPSEAADRAASILSRDTNLAQENPKARIKLIKG